MARSSGRRAEGGGAAAPSTAIAIVGMACRFPGGVESPEGFWELLREGRDAVSDAPPPRFQADAYFHPNPDRQRLYTKAGGFLDRVDAFDATFFGISPREASAMDPQQRLALELAWEALEDASIPPTALAGSRTGVFVGVSSIDYSELARQPESIDAYTNAGGALSIVANRISYAFDLRGPSMSVDTACSSSLVAVHQACRSLAAGESDLALVGGVNILLDSLVSLGFARASMLSPSGRCRTFDAEADGYVRAEGGGIVALKRLDDALADGDRIRAIVVGTGVNSDGHTVGLALPSQEAQERLLREVYARAGVDAEDLVYVEAHGTGTPAGDPIECRAIGAAVGVGRRSPCWIGSVKTNLGHLEPASGIAGLIKVVLSLEHREIPASLHCRHPNPDIPFDDLKLAVATQSQPLADVPRQLVMGVNSFGFGGTNAHVVVREADPQPTRSSPAAGASTPLLLVSAKNPESLAQLSGRYADALEKSEAGLVAFCWNVAHGRGHYARRAAVWGSSRDDVVEELRSLAGGERGVRSASGRARRAPVRTAFVFSGNGSQWVGMARQALSHDEGFRDELEAADAALRPLLDWSIRDELLADAERSRLHLTEVAQPLLFAIQVALVERLRAAGLSPDAVVGHSVGEVAAAHAAGALSLADACRVIVERSAAQARAAGRGKMAAVGLPADRALKEISRFGPRLEIAGINSPRSVTLTGDEAALDEIGAGLEAEGAFFRKLDLDYAFHSRVLDPAESDLVESLRGLRPAPAQVPFVSTVTGCEVPGESLDARYWWDNVRRPVRFAEAIQTLLASGLEVFLEVGPHAILQGYLRECFQAQDCDALALTTLVRRQDDEHEIPALLGQAWVAGCGIDPGALFPGRKPFVSLPGHPWQRSSFWRPPEALAPAPRHPLLGERGATADPTWTNVIAPDWPAYLVDHVVQGATVFPAAGYVELGMAAARDLGWRHAAVENLEIQRAIVLRDEAPQRLEVHVSEQDGRLEVRAGAPGEALTLRAVGELVRGDAAAEASPISLPSLFERLPSRLSSSDHYARCSGSGLDYGPAFQGVAETWVAASEALGRLALPEGIAADAEHVLHPALLDACLQVGLAVLPAGTPEGRATYVPVRIGRVRVLESPRPAVYCHVRAGRQHAATGTRSIDLDLLDADGRRLVEIRQVECRRIEAPAPVSQFYAWRPELRAPAPPPEGDLPELSRLANRCPSARTRRRSEEPGLRYYGEVRRALNRLATLYADRAIRRVSAGPPEFDAPSLVERQALAGSQQRFFEHLLATLAEDGVAHATSAGWRLSPPSDAADPDEVWRAMVARHPDFFAELQQLGRAGRFLDPLLRGEVTAQHVVFGDSSIAAEHAFESASSMRPCNEAAADVVRELVSSKSRRQRLRVLEVGGGTGGLTASLLPELEPDRTEYLFTDVSTVFLDRAERKFGSAFPFVRYGTLDVERDPVEQGLPEGGFDLVVAANVLHATRDLRETLRNVRRCLAPGSLLLLLELHADRWTDVVWGGFEGWWRFADAPLRTVSPLLTPSAWNALLPQEGFDQVVLLPDAERDPGISVVLARNSTPEHSSAPVAEASSPAPGPWLAFVDGASRAAAPFVDELLRRLEGAGRRVVRVCPGDHFERLDADHYFLHPRNGAGYERLLDTLAGEGCSDVLHLWGLRTAADPPSDEVLHQQDRRSLSVALLAQAISRVPASALPRLWVVTAGAVPTPDGFRGVRADQAPAWGVVRTLLAEEPDFACRLVDVELDGDSEAAVDQLLAELSRADGETEVMLRGGARYVNRLRQVEPCGAPATDERRESAAFAVELPRSGQLDEIGLRFALRRAPARGEIEVRVHAAGLNFRDVLTALGLIPSGAPDEGSDDGQPASSRSMDFAGEIASLGREVEGLQVGDRVYGIAGSFGSHVVVPAQKVWRVPDGMSFEEAATLPVVALTVYYALEDRARLRHGERVLVHSAAGGVGLAAIQYGRHRGAEILATAGTPEKREFLQRLGIDRVHSSRGLGFADEILEATGGDGVDVVLNSLSGAAIPRGVSILRPGGRFLELGKRDFFANSRLGLRPFLRNLSFFSIDLLALMQEEAELAARLWAEVGELVAKGVFRPLPHRVFPASRAADAFRTMQHAKHMGKVVLDFDCAAPRTTRPARLRLRLRRDASYLVTGGLEGFGWATARRLAERGAGHLVLVGRRGSETPGLGERLKELEGKGTEVRVIGADVADAGQVGRIVDDLREEGRVLRGVVHAAMVLDDAPVLRMAVDQWDAVLRPKVAGAWNLHRETLGLPLDFFVLYSSAASLIGNPGQASYVAANLFLDGLARERRAAGLPALAVAWGVIGDVGFVARRPQVGALLTERLGFAPLPSEQALTLLEHMMLGGEVALAATAKHSWGRTKRAFPHLARLPLLEHVGVAADQGMEAALDGRDAAIELCALSPEEARAHVGERLRQVCGSILRVAAEQVDVDALLTDLGMDSLMFVELATAIGESFGVDLPSFDVGDARVRTLAARIVDEARRDVGATPGVRAAHA